MLLLYLFSPLYKAFPPFHIGNKLYSPIIPIILMRRRRRRRRKASFNDPFANLPFFIFFSWRNAHHILLQVVSKASQKTDRRMRWLKTEDGVKLDKEMRRPFPLEEESDKGMNRWLSDEGFHDGFLVLSACLCRVNGFSSSFVLLSTPPESWWWFHYKTTATSRQLLLLWGIWI